MVSVFILLSLFVSSQVYAKTLFEDNFEQKEKSKILSRLPRTDNLVEIVLGAGVNGSSGLRVTYQANEEGSKRLVVGIGLSECVDGASLSFDVKFEEDFQFVKGGKLHGVGPLNPITGGQPMKSSGWSSRIMFEEDGAVATYLYHQRKTGEYGETRTRKFFRFRKGRFYALTLYTKLNSSPSNADGKAQIYIDGKLIAEQKNVSFWKENADESKISKLLFSTFHGGHDPSWAPRDEKGNFTKVHAVFDNFIVVEGLKVRPPNL